MACRLHVAPKGLIFSPQALPPHHPHNCSLAAATRVPGGTGWHGAALQELVVGVWGDPGTLHSVGVLVWHSVVQKCQHSSVGGGKGGRGLAYSVVYSSCTIWPGSHAVLMLCGQGTCSPQLLQSWIALP